MKRTLRVMSPAGDETVAEYEVGVTPDEQLKRIEEEFNLRMKQGYFAADITDKKNTLIREFNPNADILMFPRVQGGSHADVG